MTANIDTSIQQVNRLFYLTENKRAYSLARMKYGERLRLARERAGLTQEALAALVGMKQPSIAHLETKNATGSEFTNRLARALGVSADWLADEIGEMVPSMYTTGDPKLVAILQALEPRAEYVKDAAVQAVLTTCELADRAKANGANTGTDG